MESEARDLAQAIDNMTTIYHEEGYEFYSYIHFLEQIFTDLENDGWSEEELDTPEAMEQMVEQWYFLTTQKQALKVATNDHDPLEHIDTDNWPTSNTTDG